MNKTDRSIRFAEFCIANYRDERVFEVSTFGYEREDLRKAFEQLGCPAEPHPFKELLTVKCCQGDALAGRCSAA